MTKSPDEQSNYLEMRQLAAAVVHAKLASRGKTQVSTAISLIYGVFDWLHGGSKLRHSKKEKCSIINADPIQSSQEEWSC
jgi:hypothetical protein